MKSLTEAKSAGRAIRVVAAPENEAKPLQATEGRSKKNKRLLKKSGA